MSTTEPIAGLVADLFRHAYGRVVAALVGRLGPERFDLAEDATQDALLAALRTWPFAGVPADPAAWLYQAAWRRALDRVRHESTAQRLEPALAAEAALATPGETDVPDDLLALLVTCAALPLPREVGVPLALNVIAGLSAREIARALLLEDATVAQRLVRAKRSLRAAPELVALRSDGAALAAALPAAVEVVYLIFNEGFAPTRGPDPIRLDLCAEALRLATALAIHPSTRGSTTHALAGLTCLLAARLPARADGGQLILLPDQDRTRWDPRLVAAGFRHLQSAIGGDPVTRLHLEAEIAALHAAAPSFGETDWGRIVAAYDKLLQLEDSPVVRLNRAVALGELRGAAVGFAELEVLSGVPALKRSPWYHAARGRLLAAGGRRDLAHVALTCALALTETGPARDFLARELARVAVPA
ncbi:MAG: RNA polymerase subunit sigma-70 [Gemmatimonadetes bacterium]|nr:RNA polymerase subunit sigma-70 [Gemmatimonadota bacterium]